MLIKIKKPWEISENDTTSIGNYKTRRDFIKAAGIMTAAGGIAPYGAIARSLMASANPYDGSDIKDELNDKRAILNYNNYYEFGMENQILRQMLIV
jgi:hypothetical protein